jgi:hypothetical protein
MIVPSHQMKRATLTALSILLTFSLATGQDSSKTENGAHEGFGHTLSTGNSIPIMDSRPGLFLGLEGHWQVSYGLSDHFSAIGGMGYTLGFKYSLLPITLGGKLSYPSRRHPEGNFYLFANAASFFVSPFQGYLSPEWGFTVSIGRATSGPIAYGLEYRSFLSSFITYRAVSAYIAYQL